MIPCKECLVYTSCKYRIGQIHTISGTGQAGVTDLAAKVKCEKLAKYLWNGNNKEFNLARKTFGLSESLTCNRDYMISRIKFLIPKKGSMEHDTM